MTVRIHQLTIYPIKSCGGIAQQQAKLTTTGLAFDRQWCVVDEATGHFLTQRSLPRMALIQPRLGLDALHIKAPGMLEITLPYRADTNADGEACTVTVWDDQVAAFDQGDLIAHWFSKFLQQSVRLVRFDPDQQRLSSKTWTGQYDAANAFSDGYPILLTHTASLDDLNHKLAAKGQPPLPMNRFRPNLVIEGLPAFEEDYLDTLTAASGVILKAVKPCPRCPIPTINQETAEVGNEPTDTLATYRANPRVGGGITFGQNLILLAGVGQLLSVGEALEEDIAFD